MERKDTSKVELRDGRGVAQGEAQDERSIRTAGTEPGPPGNVQRGDEGRTNEKAKGRPRAVGTPTFEMRG